MYVASAVFVKLCAPVPSLAGVYWSPDALAAIPVIESIRTEVAVSAINF